MSLTEKALGLEAFTDAPLQWLHDSIQAISSSPYMSFPPETLLGTLYDSALPQALPPLLLLTKPQKAETSSSQAPPRTPKEGCRKKGDGDERVFPKAGRL